MAAHPKEIAELLISGGSVTTLLTNSEFEDVVYHIARKFEGEDGYKLLTSESVRIVAISH